MITLRDVTIENWLSIVKLSTTEEQANFVASNSTSLAQAHFQPECIPLGIYDDEVSVGFMMYCLDLTDHEYWIFRLMIDKKSQSKGYGRVAMELLLERIKQDKNHHVLFISFDPQNEWAVKLYSSLGFIADGRVVEDEVVYRLDYGN